MSNISLISSLQKNLLALLQVSLEEVFPVSSLLLFYGTNKITEQNVKL